MKHLPGAAIFAGALAIAVLASVPARAEPIPDDQLQFFEKQIRPVLVKECYECHSKDAKEIEGKLTLETREGTRKGGERGPAVVPGDVTKSLLIKALRQSDEDLQMPPEKKLSADVIADFEKWITMGAPDPRDGEAASAKTYGVDIEEGRSHWAFQVPRPPAIPEIKHADWPRNDVDRFVLSALEARGLEPVGDAERGTLLRRLSFDLTGLPPTPEELETFLSDESSEALGNAVDRLLASPRFGERWARHWLDVARYAESTGKTVNFFYPHAWRYRDYVIAAFNSDKPYDQFIREQLAGDLIPSDDPQVQAERMIATGFLAMGPKTLNERSGLKHELDIADEQIDVTSQAFLGITAACARCHDHKFDPIPQADYYALAGIFRSTETCYGTFRFINAQRPSQLMTLPDDAGVEAAVADLSDSERERIQKQIDDVRASIREMEDPIRRFLTSGRISMLQAQLDAYDPDGKPKLLAMGVRDKRAGPEFRRRPFRIGPANDAFVYNETRVIADSPIYTRGEADQPGDKRIPRGTLQVLTSTPLEVTRWSSGRLELADWIASRDNPLTARVMVNRIWLQLFGRGLVPTADDFGLAGRPPTHPELLDHLAIHFMDNGWSVKQLIRYLVTSRVYQLSSTAAPEAMSVDPDNTLLWRMSPRRLDAECLRDALLAVSGQLDTTPPVGSAVARAGEGPVDRFGFVPISRSIDDPRDTHRSIYLPVIRDNLPEAMALFDAADPSLITASRQQTTVPAQGLYLLNNEFVLRAADAAAGLLQDAGSDTERIQLAFVRFFGRDATNAERESAEKFLASYRDRLPARRFRQARSDSELWSAFSQAMFASAEFQYRK